MGREFFLDGLFLGKCPQSKYPTGGLISVLHPPIFKNFIFYIDK